MSAPQDYVYQPSKDGKPTKSLEEMFGICFGYGYDPLSKKNGTTLDYVPTLHHDTYDFIRPEQFDLKGRAVFITGASRGLGREFAIAYAKAGVSKIGIGARSSLDDAVKDIKAAAKEAGKEEPEVLAVNLDVTKNDSVTKAAADVEKAFGGLDILINNAGITDETVPMADVDPAGWWETFEVNILGMFLVTRSFVPLLVKHAESLKTLVNISSLSAFLLLPYGSAYQLTKFAQVRFSQLCDAEYRHQGLLAFNIHPGSSITDISKGGHPDIVQFLTDKIEIGAHTLVWLTAERREWLAGRFVTANWDMRELLEKKERIMQEDHLKLRLSVGLD